MRPLALRYSRIPVAAAIIGLCGSGSITGLALQVPGAMAQTSPAPAPSAPAPAPAAPAPAAPAAGAPSGAVGETQTGLAAYYAQGLQGRRTASGERFDNGAMTTAHQTLPFGTRVRVTTVKTNRSVVLRVNDRGPTQANRIVDVSRAAAQRLGIIRAGLVEVKLEVVQAARARRRA